MEKLIMAVAAVVGLGVGFVHAEVVNFDGKGMDTVSFMETIRTVDVSQGDRDIKPVSEKVQHVFSASPCGLACGAGQLTNDCRCSPGSFDPLDNPGCSGGWYAGKESECPPEDPWSQSIPTRSYSLDNEVIAKNIVRYYHPLQKGLRVIIQSYCDAHKDCVDNLLQAAHDNNTEIMYDKENIYLISGKTTLRFKNKELADKINTLVPRTKFIEEAGWVIIGGCLVSDDCWDHVGDAVSNVSEWYNSGQNNDPHAHDNDNAGDGNCASQGTC